MDRNKLTILVFFVIVLGLTVGLQMLHGNGDGEPAAPPPPARPNLVGQFRGVSLQLHNGDANHPYEQYISEIAETGANTLCLVVTGYQENGSSSSIFIDGRKSPSPAKLRKLIDHAHRLNLRVILMPIVLLDNPRDGEWRGKIAPPNWDDWWERYTNFIMHFVHIAAEKKVEGFVVGSELISTERQEKRWRTLIARVRKHYGGLLSYSANWDHYRVVSWWDDLDMIGMTTYYDLTGGKDPTLPRLREAWKPLRKEILSWRAKINRPILFTEVGWPNQVTCAQYPWDYYRSPDKPAPEAQANCFRAFFQTWADREEVAGFLVWEWRNHPGQKTGPKDTSYTPIGKPAMDVISKYLNAPDPSGDTGKTAASRPASQPAADVGEQAELQLRAVGQ